MLPGAGTGDVKMFSAPHPWLATVASQLSATDEVRKIYLSFDLTFILI